jgi:hypothetical protein
MGARKDADGREKRQEGAPACPTPSPAGEGGRRPLQLPAPAPSSLSRGREPRIPPVVAQERGSTGL